MDRFLTKITRINKIFILIIFICSALLFQSPIKIWNENLFHNNLFKCALIGFDLKGLSCVGLTQIYLNFGNLSCSQMKVQRDFGYYKLRTEDIPIAISELEEALKCNHNDEFNQLWLGQAYLRSGVYLQAFHHLRASMALNPIIALAEEYSAKGNIEIATNLFEIAAQNSQDINGYSKDGYFIREYAKFLLSTSNFSDYEKAIIMLNAYLENNNSDLEALIILSNGYEKHGNKNEAEKSLIKATDLFPKNALVNLELANFYLSNERYSDAYKYILVTQSLDPDNGWAMITAAKILYYNRDYTKAIQVLSPALKNEDAVIRFRTSVLFGDIYFRLGDCKESLFYYTDALNNAQGPDGEIYKTYIKKQLSLLQCN